MNDEANGYPEVVMPEVTPKRLLEGQKALVTGANSGIGKGVAIALGAEGADVVVNWVSGQEAADGVVKEIRAHRVEANAAQRGLLPLAPASLTMPILGRGTRTQLLFPTLSPLESTP